MILTLFCRLILTAICATSAIQDKTNSLNSGDYYLIGEYSPGDYYAAAAYGGKGYYLATSVDYSKGKVSNASKNMVMTIKKVKDGYTIKDARGSYWAANSSAYNIWTITAGDNGKVSISSADGKGKIVFKKYAKRFYSGTNLSLGSTSFILVPVPSTQSTSTTTSTETKPAETKPVETKPVETKPVETKPAETKPEATNPVQAVKTTGWLELPATSSQSGVKTLKHYAMMDGTRQRNYTCLYDASMNASYWVAYPICASHLGSGRKESWGYDPEISSKDQTSVSSGYGVSIETTNYVKNSYARGHQIPNADRNGNEEMMAQTYYSTNMTPQIQNGFNGLIWAKLEAAVRNMVPANDTLYVVTGAAFKKVGGNEEVSYVTNRNDSKVLPVPNYYYKVVLKVKRTEGVISEASAIGFWMPHDDLKGHNYSEYVTSVDQIEEWTGYNFFVNLSNQLQSKAESNTSLQVFTDF